MSKEDKQEECCQCHGESGWNEFKDTPDGKLCVGCWEYFMAPTKKINKHTCQLGDEECNECLQEWRRNRYGDDIHDTNCVCNDCQPIGGYQYGY
jgi:hypothetical protein